MAPFDLRQATSLISCIRQDARTYARMDGGRKNTREEEKQRRFEEVFVLNRVEKAARLIVVQAVLFELLSLREKRTTSKWTLAVFVPNCTYEGRGRTSVLCK